jgi:hypothetical protein
MTRLWRALGSRLLKRMLTNLIIVATLAKRVVEIVRLFQGS